MKKIRKSFFFFLALIFVIWLFTIIFAVKYPWNSAGRSTVNLAKNENIVDLDISGYGIYVNDQKIGYSISRQQKTEKGIRINEKSVMNISAYGTSQTVTTYSVSEADENLNLKSFYSEVISGEHRVRSNGIIKNDSIFLTIENCGEKKNVILSIGDKPFVPASVERVVQNLRIKKDTLLSYAIFEPLSEKVVDIDIRWGGEKNIEVDGQQYNTNEIIVNMLGLESRLYFDNDGRMLLESSPMGITMKRESLDKIADMGKSETGLKIYETYAIYPQGKIVNPRELKHLVVEVRGLSNDFHFLEDKRQQYENGIITINVQNPVADFSVADVSKEKFAEQLKSTPFVPCDDKEITGLSNKITGDGKKRWEDIEKIIDWVYKNIRKAPTFSIPYAKEVLSRKVGDCNEHAVLFAALSRSIGVPTKVVVGIVYVDGAFYYHAWNEVYWGRWIACDPVFGQHFADATHIKLGEGTLLDFLKVVKIVGQLNIKILESN